MVGIEPLNDHLVASDGDSELDGTDADPVEVSQVGFAHLMPVVPGLRFRISIEELDGLPAHGDFAVEWCDGGQGDMQVAGPPPPDGGPIAIQWEGAAAPVRTGHDQSNTHRGAPSTPPSTHRMQTVDAVHMTPPTPLPQCTGSAPDRQDPATSKVTATWLPSAGTCKGAYVHVPFCFHKCHYCDFFSVVGQEGLQGDFLDTIERELATVGPHCAPIDSIFIGGGTPTLLEAPLLARLLDRLQRHIPLEIGAEWTVEANPETIDQEKVEVLVGGGVTRVSIGAQSFDQSCLDALDRRHGPEKVAAAVDRLRAAGISSINLDIIFAIPGQTLDMLRRDLDAVIALNPEHVSCYGLTYEPGTPLHRRRDEGQVRSASQDEERDMFALVMDTLRTAGYEQYEISNFARPGHACRHNLLYWTNGNWWPFGPSAAGHVSGRRWRNIPRLADYLAADPMPPIDQLEAAGEDVAAGESFMMGLRLRRGMPRSRIQALLGGSGGITRAKAIELHREAGLLEWRDDHLRLTEDGLYLADTVIGDLLCTATAAMADT